MRATLSTVLAVAAAVPSVFAHYNFDALIVNGDITEPYEYVRQTTNSNSPVEDVTSDDIICNAGGLDADIRAKTKTHPVKAGDEVGFTVANDLGHPGPLAVYMSKAPSGTDTSDYLGDGDWFKVYELTTSDITDEGLQWATYVNNQGIHNFTFTLPEELPAGNYLMRAEHVGLHAAGSKGGAQFYIGCAQLEVSGTGTGTPAPVVKFPGAYDGEEPGLLLSIYYPAPTSYTAPGPKVWPSGCEDHTANLAGQTSDGDCTGSEESTGGDDTASPSAPAAEEPSTTFATLIPTVSTPSNGTENAAEPTETVIATPVPTAVEEQATSAESEAPVATSSPGSGAGSCAARRRAKRGLRMLKRSAKKMQRKN